MQMKCNLLCSDGMRFRANVNHSIPSKRGTARSSRIISLPCLFLFVICARLLQQQNSNFLSRLPFKYSNLTVSQKEESSSTAEEVSLESSNISISGIRRNGESSVELESPKTFPPRNETPLPGWVYEPPRVGFFWKKMADRKFISQIYPRLKSFNRVLDVGARGYNRYCKSMLNSSTTKYYQVEPFPPEVMDNDGFLHCKVHEIPELYPEYKLFFDAVLDIGVLGAGQLNTFNSTSQLTKDILDYMRGLLYVLKPKGLWVLKTSDSWVPDSDAMFNQIILPHFDLRKLGEWESGIQPTRASYTFYFMYRKEQSVSLTNKTDIFTL